MDFFSKPFKIQPLTLLKLVLFMVTIGAVLCSYYPVIAWILVFASFLLVFFEFSSMWSTYKAKPKEKKKE